MFGGWWLLLTLWLQSLSEPLPKVTAVTDLKWERLFQNQLGWIGADCAYSVPLNNGETFLWLFDDTFVGEVRDGKRANAVMVRNSIAIQDGQHPPTAKVRFIVGVDQQGKPTDFVKPPDGHGWFWFGHGVVASERLWLFLWQMEATGEPSVFGFRMIANWLAEVPNFDAPPKQWRFTFHPLPFFQASSERLVYFGGAVLQDGDWVYVYGGAEDRTRRPLKRGLLVARVPADRISDFAAWQFLTQGRWTDDWHAATPFGDDLGAEFSVSYLPKMRRYLLVYSPADLSPVIKVRFAPTPVGPWSEAAVAYVCPEPSRHSSVFCYAAKGHPEISAGEELLVTYATNSFEFRQLLSDARLYFLCFVRLRFSAP